MLSWLCSLVILGWCLIVASSAPLQCDVYCYGKILETVQEAGIYPDDKTFVDMPMKDDPEVILYNFEKLNSTSKAVLEQFLNDNFLPPGSELQSWIPSDWKENPAILNNITNPHYKTFASELNKIWLLLGKKLIDDVYKNPQRYSFIPIPNPFIVPGGRFREFYYWDTFWIIKGLLACDLVQTVKGIIENILEVLANVGFVPNGTRIYYLTRSQPPLLSEMVLNYYEVTKDLELLKLATPLIQNEYMYWMTTHAVRMNKNYTLNHYYAYTSQPRPESYMEDKNASRNMNQQQTIEFYSNIVAATESGMDFSSRWFTEGASLESIKTRSFIQVELNSILYKVESNLNYFYQELKLSPPVNFTKAMEDRKNAMNYYLWNESTSQWHDYNLDNHSQILREYPTNFHPLWSGAYDETNQELKAKILNALEKSTLIQPGGILTTLMNTGQQWDSPNAWPPLVSWIIFGLRRANTEQSNMLAKRIAMQWIEANWIGYNSSGDMFEKFDAYVPGKPGSGGEYTTQIGFGWTNGVVLELLQIYGNETK